MKKRALRLEHPTAYYQGHADRQAGRCRLSQPYGHLTVDCGWWLAGTTKTWRSSLNRKTHRALQLHRRRNQFTLPPSGLKEAPHGDGTGRARPAQAREICKVAGRRPALEGLTRN